MKTMKAIAALCAAVMAFSTMALPVQAKTSKTETEVITMDDDTTATKPKTKKTTTKKSKSSQVSWKNAGKPLQCTVKTEEDFYKAYSTACRLYAPSLKVTLDKSYKGKPILSNKDGLTLTQEFNCRYVYDISMENFGFLGWEQEHNDDVSVVTFYFMYSETYGNAFPYAYNTGDTSVLNEKYTNMYKIFSEAADNCTETEDLGKAKYAWDWVIDNLVYDSGFRAATLVKTFDNPTADGKYPAVCENYANAFVLLMRMLNVHCWNTPNEVVGDILEGKGTKDVIGGLHQITCAKINGEYRYFDPTFGKTKEIGLAVFDMSAEEAAKWYAPFVLKMEDQHRGIVVPGDYRVISYSELEKYYIW